MVALAEQPSDTRPLDPISYYAPGMGIFFLFFAIGFTAKGWFEEAAAGTLERTATAASVGEIVAGKALSVFVYGLASLTTVAVVTSLAFGAEWGGVLPAVLGREPPAHLLDDLAVGLALEAQRCHGHKDRCGRPRRNFKPQHGAISIG